MAVTAIFYELNTPEGEDGKDSFTLSVNAKLEMEAGDNVVTALSYTGLPAKGTTYNFFGETHPATLQRMRARITKNTPSQVIAVVTLEYDIDQPGDDSGGGSNSDPESVQPILTPGYRFVSMPIKSATFCGFFDADNNETPPSGGSLLQVGERGTIRNAAGHTYFPIPEVQIGFPTLTLEKYYRRWNNLWDEAIENTNDADYRIIFPDGTGTIVYDRAFAKNELLLKNITPTQRSFGAEIWYWVRFELWIGDHKIYMPNIGLAERYPGWGAGPKVRPIRNEAGEMVEDAQPLDVDGVLAADNATELFTAWEYAKEFPFDLLGLTQ